ALATIGISPLEFLVLPRMLVLIVMMPHLTVYSDLVGILGGAVVGICMLGLGTTEYIEQTRAALEVTAFLIGVTKTMAYGASVAVVVGLAGFLRGMQSGRSAAAVGLAATSAVVTSIVCLIVLDGIFAVILHVLGF